MKGGDPATPCANRRRTQVYGLMNQSYRWQPRWSFMFWSVVDFSTVVVVVNVVVVVLVVVVLVMVVVVVVVAVVGTPILDTFGFTIRTRRLHESFDY